MDLNLPSFDKIVFVLAVAALAFFYGFASSTRGWFPNDLLVEAWRQAKVVIPIGVRSPPFVYDRVYDPGTRVKQPGGVQPGLTLVASNWSVSDWKPGLVLIDRNGRTRHRWTIDPVEVFPNSFTSLPVRMQFNPVHGSHLFSNGDVLINITDAGTARLDACGDVLWRLPANSHHSIAAGEDGTFWISSATADRPPSADALGIPGSAEYFDRLLHVTGDGEILQDIGIHDVLAGHDDLVRHVFRYQGTGGGVTHLNDVEPLDPSLAEEYPLFEAGDLLVSLRNLHLVLVVDPDSERVKWHASEPFVMQHDPDFMGDGWIGVFDNNRDLTGRGERLGGSRILALQPHTDSTRVLFPTADSDPFYTGTRGKWQRLENGNLLLTESNAGRVVEVSPDGRTVWEWAVEPYDESSMPAVTEGTRYPLTVDEVADWPCSPSDSGEDQEASSP